MTDDGLRKAATDAGLETELEESMLEVARKDSSSNANKRFFLAILSVVPWVGVLISAAVARWAEFDQDRSNAMFRAWIQEHDARLRELEAVGNSIASQAERAGVAAQERLNSDAYLPLVRQGFRVWDKSETHEKRELVRRVLTNAACDSLSTDDFVRRFIEWIDQYNELHFRVIRALYKQPMSTRADLWDALHGAQVREDSADADLFKLLIRDLSTGQVIRQERQTDHSGSFIKKRPARNRPSHTMKSAFDDIEEYVLTDLGKNFVHYALNEVIPKLGVSSPASSGEPGAPTTD
jgi:hypothetical protein